MRTLTLFVLMLSFACSSKDNATVTRRRPSAALVSKINILPSSNCLNLEMCPSLPEPMRAMVDYASPASAAQSEFDWVDDDITDKRFPIDGRKSREVTFEYVSDLISSEDTLVEMRRRNLRLATLSELRGFAKEYPCEQQNSMIVALGSTTYIDGGRVVPVLYGDSQAVGVHRKNDKRGLRLVWLDVGWSGLEEFLAVRE